MKKFFLSLLIVLLIPPISEAFGYQFNSLIGKDRLVSIKASISSAFTISHQFLLEKLDDCQSFQA